MNNGILSVAGTGNASVTGNTTAGSATTGDTKVVSSIINMLQSSSNVLDNPNLLTFTADINGDVNGDLLLDPSTLSAIQPANDSTTLDSDVTVNNSVNAAIHNNINLDATTGDAAVASNTSAGNATTGTADAVANVVNVLNSAVTAGQSFLGVININGNLNGDILLPPGFIDTLLASNTPRYTVNTTDINASLNVNNTNNQAINNDVTASAVTGNATVVDNTSAGNATSGSANTNITVFNLTGSNVVASNCLLVFVNVLGTWYGLIMDAPVGTTAASLGGGVSSSTAIDSNTTLNNTNNQSINNNVHVASQSGDASVTNNTKAGNATTGNATASVNLMNMINNSLSLNGWFGLLFINVFGTWNGSFGIDTAAGNSVAVLSATPSGNIDGTIPAPVQVFRFVPHRATSGSNGTSTYTTEQPSVVLASHTQETPILTTNPVGFPAVVDSIHPNLAVIIIGSVFALLLLVFSERHQLFRLFHRG